MVTWRSPFLGTQEDLELRPSDVAASAFLVCHLCLGLAVVWMLREKDELIGEKPKEFTKLKSTSNLSLGI